MQLQQVHADHASVGPESARVLQELGRISASMGRWENALGFLSEGLPYAAPRSKISVQLMYMMAQAHMALEQYPK